MGTQGMRKTAALVLALAIVVGTVFTLRSKSSRDGVTLNVCTWSNYFPENLINEFTTKTGIKVQLSYISSNEELFAKLKAGATGFDVIQPSDYMIRQMAALEMLAPLDAQKLPHLSHLDPYYRNLPYDPGLKVSVPFTWGTTGIAINTKHIKVPAGGVGWEMLYQSPDPKHTSLLDDMREVFAGALFKAGEDPNTTHTDTLVKARATVAAAKDRVLMFTSEPKPLLLRGELNIAHIYSSDAVQAQVENPDIQFFIPKEGAVIWTDGFAIPKTSPHLDAAHVFINYFLDPENALTIITQNHLATPNKTALLRLPEAVQKNPNLYPGLETRNKLRFLNDIGESLNAMNRLWTELKS